MPEGFGFSAATAGIKASGRPDLALVCACKGTTAAAVFTRNRVVAAPVEIGRRHLHAGSGRIRAVIVNSGNANCATGKTGLRDCRTVCKAVGRRLGVKTSEVFPSSTGIIGVPLPTEKILRALPHLHSSCSPGREGMEAFARAILTTDTRTKIASREFRTGGKTVRLLGIAKGSGMIQPRLATMLVYLFTDAALTSSQARQVLRDACDVSFNCMSVDGDTSTNDTVLLLASGRTQVGLRSKRSRAAFVTALRALCQSLAEQIVCDGEGMRHLIRLRVEQARTRDQALVVARAISNSALVKTAWAGCDPNWGRILAAAGYSGAQIDPNRTSIFIGGQQVCRNGVLFPFDALRAHKALSQPVCDIRLTLGQGRASVLFYTCDLTAEYVRINSEYST
jgi:glutamate N-acetyltransferase/amino-acid N-acetyltransferase